MRASVFHTLLRIIAPLLCLLATSVSVAQDPSVPAPIPAPQPKETPPPSPTVPTTPPSATNAPAPNEITPELDRAVAAGLAALAQTQSPDGSFGQPQLGRAVAITSIACIAFMADGNAPGRGPYGDAVRKGLEYITQNATESGLIATPMANSPMYGHGFATLFLGEVYGMTDPGAVDSRVYEALSKAVRLIESTQNSEGGWRYNPTPFDADVSVTICQIMALRSARNAGLEVKKEVVDKAVEYVRTCQNPDGGFRYQMSMGASAWPRSAAGVASLYYAGIYEDRALENGLKYLMLNARPGRDASQPPHYYYGHYYSVQAMFLAGGAYWQEWWPLIRGELLRNQEANGMWSDPNNGEEYGTGMALIILQMPKRYLPIFQK